MNVKALLTVALAVALVGGGTLGLLTMDSDNSEGAPSSTAYVGQQYTGVISSSDDQYFVSVAKDVALNQSLGNPDGFELTWHVSQPWLTMTVSGDSVILTGIPTATGTVTVLLQVGINLDGTDLAFRQYSYSLTISNITLSFSEPPAFYMVVGDSLDYLSTRNLASTVVKESGASWVTVSSDGRATGTVPSSGIHTFTMKASSTVGPSQVAYQTVTIHAYDSLAFTTSAPSEIVATEMFSFTPATNIGATITVSDLPNGAVYQNGIIKWVPIEDGTFSFKVKAVASSGPSQAIETTVTIEVFPKLEFTSQPVADLVVIPNGATVQFYSMSTGATSVLWEFSDGQTSDEWYPEMTFAEGEVTAKLTAFNDVGSDVKEVVLNIVGDGSETGMNLKQFIEENAFVIAIVLILALALAGAKFIRRKG